MKGDFIDLENRTAKFALDIRKILKQYWRNGFLQNDIRQVIRSSGSVSANYIEANENLGTKDFLFRIRISKKEAKESKLWLYLLRNNIGEENVKIEIERLIGESEELIKIMAAIIRNKKI